MNSAIPDGWFGHAALLGLVVPEPLVTVTAIVPECPELVPVIVAVPAATPVTSPDDETVATPVFDDDQLGVVPLVVAPDEDLSVAVACWVAPTAKLTVAGVTVTLATGAAAAADTVMLAVADNPDTDTVTVADPALTPVTIPDDETVAADVLLLDQVGVTLVTTVPLAVVAVAVSCDFVPAVIDTVFGETATAVTGACTTETLAVPVTVPADVPTCAEMTAEPIAIAVTIPLVDTVATLVFDEDHVIVWPVTASLTESLAIADKGDVEPG